MTSSSSSPGRCRFGGSSPPVSAARGLGSGLLGRGNSWRRRGVNEPLLRDRAGRGLELALGTAERRARRGTRPGGRGRPRLPHRQGAEGADPQLIGARPRARRGRRLRPSRPKGPFGQEPGKLLLTAPRSPRAFGSISRCASSSGREGSGSGQGQVVDLVKEVLRPYPSRTPLHAAGPHPPVRLPARGPGLRTDFVQLSVGRVRVEYRIDSGWEG